MKGRSTVYNNIVTPELWDEVNKENKDLVKEFLDYKRSSDKSPKTIEQYYQVLRIFFVWNLQNNSNKFFIDIKKREFSKYFAYMVTELKSSPNRIATVKSVLSSLSNFIEDILDEDYEEFRNIVSKIEIPKKQVVREKTVLSKEQIEDCLERLVSDGKNQIACYMALAAASGARKAELLQFKVYYFDDENILWGSLYKTPEKIRTKGDGSRGKLLNKFTFVKQFKPYLEAWMKERQELGIENEWLFVINRDGGYEQAENHNANGWADVISKYLKCPFYFHSLRHYYTTNARASGLPDKVIQELVGWSSTDLINLYDDSEIEDTFADYFDENGIKENIKTTTLADM